MVTVLGADRRCKMETVKNVNAYIAEAGGSMFWFMQSLVNQVMSMWLRSADANPSKDVARGIGCYCMIWSAASKNSGACCLVVQISVAW